MGCINVLGEGPACFSFTMPQLEDPVSWLPSVRLSFFICSTSAPVLPGQEGEAKAAEDVIMDA